MFELTYPALLLLLPLPLLLRRILPEYTEHRAAIRAPFLKEYLEALGLSAEESRATPANPAFQLLFFALSWVLLITALARPQWIEKPIITNLPTRDLLLAIDLSGSMDTEDFISKKGKKINRLEAVKEVLDDFLDKRQGDRVGLIFFGSAPFVQVPFTEDLDVCKHLLDEAQVRMAGPQTMIGDAIGLAITIFEQGEMENRVLILLTDGNDTGSAIPPEEAARIASERNIVIHTVAVGDPAAAGESKLDEESLKQIAEVSGGGYFHANNRNELEEIYVQLDNMETKEVETISHRPKRDLFHYPLGLLLSFSLCYHLIMLASNYRRK